MNILNIDKIYICHWDKLKDRKEWMKKHLTDNQIYDYEWVECYDKNTWDVEDIKKQFPNIFSSLGNGPKNIPLKLSEISLLLKHFYIIKDIIDKKYKNALVFEDDFLLVENFIEKFNSYMTQMPENWDLAWVGSCCQLNHPYDGFNNIYKHDGSRCTHAYAISNQGAYKMISELKNINDAADWFYNRIITKLNLQNYWWEPPLAYPNGLFETSIQNQKF